jgi:hypothetical protein
MRCGRYDLQNFLSCEAGVWDRAGGRRHAEARVLAMEQVIDLRMSLWIRINQNGFVS